MRNLIVTALLTGISFVALSVGASAATCSFTTSKNVMSLNGNCTTATSIVVPDGNTLDGRGFTITAVDPPSDHFKGGVIKNGGTSATVKNVTVTASNLADACDAGVNRLRGIIFQGASGSIIGNVVKDVRQGDSGCQEGNSIEVRNFGSNPNTSVVTVDGNTVTGYQKTGIVANGNVDVSVSNNFSTEVVRLVLSPVTEFSLGLERQVPQGRMA